MIALLVSVFATFGQSLLWKVSGKKMKAPSYLYGTIHIQDARVASFDTTVLNALNRCEAFAMEVLLDEINMRGIQKAMMMPEGKYLNTLLSPEDFALLDSICKAKLGISAIFMNGMKPFFVSSTWSNSTYGRMPRMRWICFCSKRRENTARSATDWKSTWTRSGPSTPSA